MKIKPRARKSLPKLAGQKTVYIDCVGNLLKYSVKYPWGLFRKTVVRGYFPHPEKGLLQKLFFRSLLKTGFKRTPWQLILPGQTAGVVKRISRSAKGAHQYHVRFYADGTIDCEAEYHRFHVRHWWSGSYRKEKAVLGEILAELSGMPPEVKSRIEELWRDMSLRSAPSR